VRETARNIGPAQETNFAGYTSVHNQSRHLFFWYGRLGVLWVAVVPGTELFEQRLTAIGVFVFVLFLFCRFFESRSSPSTDPFVLWMTGGPGCSSLVALFYENGAEKRWRFGVKIRPTFPAHKGPYHIMPVGPLNNWTLNKFDVV
jgi:hypothetical protein